MQREEKNIKVDNVLCDCENLFLCLYNRSIDDIEFNDFKEIKLFDCNSYIRLSRTEERDYFDILKSDRLLICDGEIQEFHYNPLKKLFIFEYNEIVLSLTVEEMRLLNDKLVTNLVE